eukprot:95564-Pyramimonas_sp.AAC.1
MAALALRAHHASLGLLAHCHDLSAALEGALEGEGAGSALGPRGGRGGYFRFVGIEGGGGGDRGGSHPPLLQVLQSLSDFSHGHLKLATILAALQRLAQLRAATGGEEVKKPNCLTGNNGKIVSTYEPTKIMLANSPA